MEKGVLERLAGYLRDLWLSGETKPHPGERGTDTGNTRLAAIQGGKGTSGWDGKERRKSRAVIGIPYSSGVAENTEEGEGNEMKTNTKYMFGTVAVAAAAMILAACGGGGGGTSSAGGTTGTAVVATGTMTKGSVIVNGVRFEDTAANIHPDDTGKVFLPADLKDGMTVKLKGQRNDDGVTGTATEIEVENEVRGTITAKGTDSLTVLGQTVFVDGGTVFANVANFAALAVGQAVEVHGQRDASGNIRATRVELLVGAVVDEVRGVVVNKSPGPAGTFAIGGALFAFDALTVIVDPPGGQTFADGALVEVHLDSGTNRANRIEIEDDEDDEFEPAEGQEVEVEGYVTGLPGTPFQVGGQVVQTDSNTEFEGGVSADLANDVKVEAEGHMVGGVLVADKIKFKDSVRFEANLDAVGGSGVSPDNVTVLGRTVFITSRTVQNPIGGSFQAGEGVRVRAFLNQDNTTFTATRIDEDSNPVQANDHVIQGLVISSANPTIVLVKALPAGFTVDTTGLPDVNFKDDNDSSSGNDNPYPGGRTAFFGALRAGQTVVKAKGTWNAGTNTLSAREVEIE